MPPVPDTACKVGAAERESEISEVILKSALPVVVGSLGWGLLFQLLPGWLGHGLAWMPADGPPFLIHVGLMGLIGFPIFRVGAALIAFLEEQDVRLGAITILVLAILVWSFHLASGL